jgi:cell division protein FtsI (penicillin-binding protein 3)
MLDRDYKSIRVRIWTVASVFFIAFGLLGARAYTLQVTEGEKHHQKALRQTSGSVVIKARRGAIYDRQMRVLASNREVPTVVAQPRLMSDNERRLSKSLMLRYFGSPPKVLDRLDTRRYNVYLERHVSESRAEAFRKAMESMPASERPLHLGLMLEDKRAYPAGRLASPILGYTNIDMDGRMGLEKRFNKELTGNPITVEGLRDPNGNVSLETLDLSLDVPAGDQLVLTIDKAVQYVTERVLHDTVQKHDAHFGVAIVMDPNDGAIYSMAQYPSFNPNEPISQEDVPLLHNFAIEWTFEPGSTLKPFVIAQALESARFVPDEIIDCGGGQMRIGPNIIHDSKSHDDMTLSQVLSKSSNIGTARVAMELGAQAVHDILVNFGFYEKTGIPLPSESRGILAPAAKWYPIELATIAFGQGINVTALQLATAMSAIANGGMLVKPRLVYQIISPDGEVRQQFDPTSVRRVISEQTARALRLMLAEAATANGTGIKAQIAECPVAGKTGTAEKLAENVRTGKREHWTSSFAGFFPADDPKLLILVVIDEPQGREYYGGDVAAPAFRQIALEVGPMLGICTQRHDQVAEAK